MGGVSTAGCAAPTSACLGPDAETRVFGHGVYRVEPVALCDACAAVLIRLGFPLEPERRKVERPAIGAVA